MDTLITLSEELRDRCGSMSTPEGIAYVYNPIEYAWEPYKEYIERFAMTKKRVIFVGMNPGPWGMAQTGIPFGEVNAVREWLKIDADVGKPRYEHPKRPVTGLECTRSEVSRRRVWGLMRERFGSPEKFFAEHLIANYCLLNRYYVLIHLQPTALIFL